MREDDCTKHALWKPCIDPVMRWRKCDSCGHVFVEGHFTPEAAAEIFAGTQECQQVGYLIEDQRAECGRLLSWVGATGSLLDVGFGSGSLMFTADEMGWNAAGIDIRRENVDAMRQLGYEAYQCEIGDVSANVDMVTMLDVLEHMPDPRAALQQARGLASSLLVSCPNMGSMAAMALTATDENPYWAEIEHYHNFDRKRLYALLEECGWSPLRYRVSERYRLGMEVLCT
jgi:protein O-GlcNAc transferase